MINPLWLLGLFAAAIPLVIHLLHRSRAPKLLFSTLRFLRLAVERTRRRRRIENLLVLLLRTLLLALLAIGLAGPMIKGSGSASILIILDNSGSMDCRFEGKSRMDHAREIAHAVMTKRSKKMGVTEDEYAILVTNGPRALEKRPFERDLGSLGAYLETIFPVGATADMAAAISRAAEMFDDADSPNRQLLVLGDLQEISWDGVSEKHLGEEVDLIIADLGREEFRSLAVTEVAAIGGATIAGSPVVMAATIYNASRETIANRAVTLVAEGKKVIRRTVTVEPDKTARVIFNPVWDIPGTYTGRIALDETNDSMELDNDRFFKVEIRDRIRALVIKEQDDEGYLDDAYFLVRALDPRRVLGAGARSVIDPKVVTVDAFSEEVLGDIRVVFVLNVKTMSRDRTRVLMRLLERGGSVIFFPGDNADPERWALQFSVTGEEGRSVSIIPEIVGGPREVGKGRFIAIRHADLEHPVMSLFQAMPRRFFEAVHAYRYLPIETGPEGQSRVLLSLEGKTPFLVEQRVGLGRVFFFTVTANREWSNFPLTTAYPVLLSELIFSITADEVKLTSYTVGDRVDLTFPGAANAQFEFFLTDPSGETVRVETDRDGPDAVVAYTDTLAPGVYTYKTTGAVTEEGAFVANIDPQEARLKRAEKRTVINALAGHEVIWTADAKRTEKVARSLREDRPLTEWFMFAVLAFAIFEVWLANRAKARQEVSVVGISGREAA